MPFSVIRWIVGRTGEVPGIGVVIMCERGPIASGVPTDTREEGESCEKAERADEVKSELVVSPWDGDYLVGNCG